MCVCVCVCVCVWVCVCVCVYDHSMVFCCVWGCTKHHATIGDVNKSARATLEDSEIYNMRNWFFPQNIPVGFVAYAHVYIYAYTQKMGQFPPHG